VAWQLIIGGATFAVGVILVSRRPANVMAWFVSIFLILLGFANGEITSTLTQLHPVLAVPAMLTQGALSSCIFLLFFTFPDGRFVPGWLRFPALVATVLNLLVSLPPPVPAPSPQPDVGPPPWYVALIAVPLAAQVYRYRWVSGPVQRQQTKWVLFGFVVYLVGFVVAAVVATVYGGVPKEAIPWSVETAITVVFGITGLAVPITIGFAVLEHRLFDVDVVIRRTVVYAVLIVTLILAYLGCVVALQRLFQGLTGGQSDLAIVGSTLTIAALFNPARQRTRAFIDRRFYRHKYDTAAVLTAFGSAARDEVELDHLTGRLVTVVEDTMRPAHLSLWLRPLSGLPFRPELTESEG
jgi:hypothetical protein